MRYIKTITLENFQSYKKETIHFTPGLNIILGSSDSGKSAILRAISFVLHNYPRNNTIIHNGAKDCRVTIEFSDGVKVARIKGTRNAYLAIDKDGKKYSFDKIDKSVPDEIKALLNYPPEDEYNGFISYADQFSKMFLVDLSPSDLPRSLSSLTGIEVLEESAKQLMQNYKSGEKQTKSDEKEYARLSEEYDAYNFVDEYELKVESVRSKYAQLEALHADYENLKKFDIGDLRSVNSDCVLALEKIISLCDAKLNKVNKIKKLAEEYDKLKIFNILDSNADASALPRLSKIIDFATDKLKLIDDYKALIDKYEKLKSFNQSYESLNQEFDDSMKKFEEINSELEILTKDFEDFKKMLIDNGIQCEACGNITG